jgi:PAS domain S-box-containing protein
MDRTIDKGLVIGAGLLIAVLIVDAGLSYKNTRHLHGAAQMVAHTTAVMESLEEIVSTAKEAESNQRGYLITGDSSYQMPFTVAMGTISQKVARARTLTVDNPRQQARFTELEKHIRDKFLIMVLVMDIQRKGRVDAATKIMKANDDKRAMEGIQTLIDEMKQEEQTLLNERTTKAARAYRIAVVTGVSAALLSLVLFVGFIYLLRQNALQRAKAALEVQEQREWLRTTLASIGDAVIATDTTGRVTLLNKVAQTLTGWKEQEAAGKPLEDVFRIVNEQTRQTVENPAARALREGTIVGLANHTLLLSKEGKELPIDDSAAPIRNAEGNVAGVVLVFRDVTTRRQAEKSLRERSEQLAEADRMKNEFLAMLAHELRNPLAPLQNALHLIELEGAQSAGNKSEIWAIMKRQVEALVRLVDDLLDVSRITRGKIGIHKQPVEVSTIVSRAVESSRPLIDARRQQLAVSISDELMRIDADLTRMTQVLLNLLNNAAKYTPEGGHISLTVEHDGSNVVFHVRDNGIGIRAEMLPKIFDLFSQSEQTLDRSQGGLGIGLTLARRLTEMHSGTVAAFSDGPGKGSEFVVRVPLLKEGSSSDGDVSSTPADAYKRDGQAARRVLLVDDNVDSAKTLALLLRKWGHEITVAYDGEEALTAADGRAFDLILLDIGLPGKDGYEVAQLLRVNPLHSQTRLVALTGYGTEADRRRSKAAGFDEHIIKPADFEKLRELFASIPG